LNPFRRLLLPVSILVVVVVIGVAGFMLIEGWSKLDSAYMVVITLFTIGFQEVHPLSPAGRMLTIFIAIAGVGSAVYAAGQTVEMIVEGEVLGFRKRRLMKKLIRDIRDHYIICGYGRVGHQVAEDFTSTKIPFVVIDAKPETAAQLDPKRILHIVGDATSDELLDEAGISKARGLVACSDSDVANVYVTLSARALNPRLFIVARASQRETEKKLRMAGANRVISPYFISGRRMAAMASKPVVTDFLDMVTHGGELEFGLHEIKLPESSSLAGRTLEETEIRTKSGALVLAIRKPDGNFDIQPRANSIVGPGDTLIVIGTPEQIERLEELVQ
jgi:voltage-gated potassium channel